MIKVITRSISPRVEVNCLYAVSSGFLNMKSINICLVLMSTHLLSTSLNPIILREGYLLLIPGCDARYSDLLCSNQVARSL